MVQPDVRTAHPYYMYDAVHQQPEAVTAMLQSHSVGAREAATQLGGQTPPFPRRHRHLVARRLDC